MSVPIDTLSSFLDKYKPSRFPTCSSKVSSSLNNRIPPLIDQRSASRTLAGHEQLKMTDERLNSSICYTTGAEFVMDGGATAR